MRTAFDFAHDGVRLAGGTVPHRLRNRDRHFTYAADGLGPIQNAGFREDKRLFDDYGSLAHVQQKIALDTFARERGVSIMTLPTGQGLLIKS